MSVDAEKHRKLCRAVTLIEDAIHNPNEPRHFMTVDSLSKRHRARAGEDIIATADLVWVMSEVANKIIHPVVYFHRQDIDAGQLERSELETHCPLKGKASYYHLDLDGNHIENAVWAYEDPIEEAKILKELMAFDSRYVRVETLD